MTAFHSSSLLVQISHRFSAKPSSNRLLGKPLLEAAPLLPQTCPTRSTRFPLPRIKARCFNRKQSSPFELGHKPKMLTKVVRLHLYKQALIKNMLHKHKLSKQSSVLLMSMEHLFLSMGELTDIPHKSLPKGTACFFSPLPPFP